jgi:hypothetical protein
MQTKRLVLIPWIILIILLSASACAPDGSPEMVYADAIQAMIDQVRVENEKYGRVMANLETTLDERRIAADEMAAKIDQLMVRAADLKPPTGCSECRIIQTELRKSVQIPLNIRRLDWKTIQLAILAIELKYGQSTQE